MPRKGDPKTLAHATRGMRQVVKPTEQQKRLVHSLPGAKQNGLRRARQIASQRQQNPYVRDEPRCIQCLAPRDRKSFPVCEDCTTRRKAGLR